MASGGHLSRPIVFSISSIQKRCEIRHRRSNSPLIGVATSVLFVILPPKNQISKLKNSNVELLTVNSNGKLLLTGVAWKRPRMRRLHDYPRYICTASIFIYNSDSESPILTANFYLREGHWQFRLRLRFRKEPEKFRDPIYMQRTVYKEIWVRQDCADSKFSHNNNMCNRSMTKRQHFFSLSI
jgi:hypothetical protein